MRSGGIGVPLSCGEAALAGWQRGGTVHIFIRTWLKSLYFFL